jgi:hypothetical protein
MSNGKRGSPEARRRRPPTIDLKATEIASEPVKPAEPVDPPKESAEPPADAAPELQAGAAPPPEPPAAEPPPPEPLTAEPPTAEPPKAEPPPADAKQSDARRSPEWSERLAGLRQNADWRLAGALGAAAMLVLLLAVFATGAFNPPDPTAPLVTRIATLEQQTRELANRPPPAGVDPRALAELAARVAAAEQAMGRFAETESRLTRAEQATGRLGELESRLAKAEQAGAAPRPAQGDPALAGRVAALEAALRPLADLATRLDAANAAARDAKTRADAAVEAAQNTAAPSKEIEALTARVAALEQAAKTLQDRIAATAGADRAGRLAFTAVALRGAVDRGDPFAQELAAVRPLVTDARALAPIEPFAATGVPRAAALARELSGLTGAMLSAAGSAPREGGFIDRLQQNAERLVRIRPINEAPGDDAMTVITRADVKATHGDLSGALAEIASLPPAVRAPAQGWSARVEARNAALAAARDLAEGAVGALAKP